MVRRSISHISSVGIHDQTVFKCARKARKIHNQSRKKASLEFISQRAIVSACKFFKYCFVSYNFVGSNKITQTFLSFVPLLVSCTFELSRRDSPTEQAIAAFTILYVLFIVGHPI